MNEASEEAENGLRTSHNLEEYRALVLRYLRRDSVYL